MPAQVSGCLLGLNVGGVLEIANTFAYRRHDSEGMDDVLFQKTMLRCLAAVGVDRNVIGWYQSTPFADFCSKDLVATQFDFQAALPGSVCLMYDPMTAGSGSLGIRALRLTDKFTSRFSSSNDAAKSADGKSVLASGIFTEVPVRIHQNPVMEALLLDMAAPRAGESGDLETSAAAGDLDCDSERLELNAQAYLDKHLSLLSEQVDSMAELVVAAQVWERKGGILAKQQDDFRAKRREDNARRAAKGQKPLPERDETEECFKPLPEAADVETIEALLSAAQAGAYCREMGRMTSRNFGKVFLAGALQAKAE